MTGKVAELRRFGRNVWLRGKLTPTCHKGSIIAMLAVLAPALGALNAEAAPPADLIANGDFQTGDFTGWSIINSGSGGIAMNDGTFVPPGPGTALPPVAGGFDAVTHQGGSGLHVFRQTIDVPEGIFSASLSWNDRIRNHAGLYSDPNQEWRVLITDTNGVVIQDVFSTNPGDPLLQIGPNARSADLTGVLQDYAGQSIVVSFEEQDNLGYFNATLDDVSLLVSLLPVSKDECKGGEWQTFVNVLIGVQIFKNQGDCVSFVATKGKNPPANY